jgi:hypothetical protein
MSNVEVTGLVMAGETRVELLLPFVFIIFTEFILQLAAIAPTEH